MLPAYFADFPVDLVILDRQIVRKSLGKLKQSLTIRKADSDLIAAEADDHPFTEFFMSDRLS